MRLAVHRQAGRALLVRWRPEAVHADEMSESRLLPLRGVQTREAPGIAERAQPIGVPCRTGRITEPPRSARDSSSLSSEMTDEGVPFTIARSNENRFRRTVNSSPPFHKPKKT
jgi:hypothetical protein